MHTFPRDASRPLLAVGIAALAVMGFALGDVLTKTLAGRYPVVWLMLARYGLNLLILLAVLGPRHGRALWRTQRTGLVCLRAASLAFGSLAMAFALKVLPVGEAVAILYISPVVVILLARPVLGEPLTKTGLACALAGFCGVLAIVRPGTGLVFEGVVFALVNVGLAAIYHLTTRLLSRTETAAAMQVNSAAIGTAIFLPLALAGPPPPIPPAGDAALVVALAAALTAAHYLFTLAYREAPATLVAPFTYLHLFWGVLFGWLFFAHLPDAASLAGIALIAGSGVVLAAAGRTAHRRAAKTVPEALTQPPGPDRRISRES